MYVARYMDLLYLFESFGVELIKVRHTGQLSGVHTHLVGQCVVHGHTYVTYTMYDTFMLYRVTLLFRVLLYHPL